MSGDPSTWPEEGTVADLVHTLRFCAAVGEGEHLTRAADCIEALTKELAEARAQLAKAVEETE